MGIIGSTFARFMLIEARHFSWLLAVSALLGYFRALTGSNFMLMMAEYCGRRCPGKVSSAVSMSLMSSGLAMVTLGQFFGWLRGAFESYSLTFCAENAVVYLICGVWLFTLD